MTTDGRDQQLADLRERLARLSEAGLHINDGLDPDAVLRRVVDSACSLIGARYGVITVFDSDGQLADFLASGMTSDEAQELWAMPGGMEVLEHLMTVDGPLRVADFAAYAAEIGLPLFSPPAPMGAFVTAPILRRGERLGSIHLGRERPGPEFAREDEETLVMFASQAAMALDNARHLRDEQRARTGLETLIETSPVGVAVLDARTAQPVTVNREARRIIDNIRGADQPPEQLLDVLTIRRADGREVSLAELSLAEGMATGETVRAEEIVLGVPDGRSVTVLLNAAPVRSEGGRIESYVFVFQDMSTLEDMDRLRAEFLGMVSHELRTPLTTIRGSATTMMDAALDLDPAELRQFLRIIVEQSDNMRELIDNLLDVARIKTGTLPVSPEAVELAPLVDRARAVFLSEWDRIGLDVDFEPDLPLLMADRRQIVQVIGNLLSNAARNSFGGSDIRVSAERDGSFVEVTVADDGRGMSPDELTQLFRKFARSEAQAHDDGTGLGLAICRGIVEAHGGRIWAHSDGPSQGTRVTFTIPAAEQSAGVAPQPRAASLRAAAAGSGAGGGTEGRVLVVDDDPQTLRHVRRVLSGGGFDPIVTGDPAEALELLSTHEPHLVLLDMMLPGRDGIELMEAVLGVAEVPVVFLSAYGQKEMISRAFEAGASDYIVKPFTPTELVARVRVALRKAGDRVGRSEPYVLDDLVIDYATRQVTIGGEPVPVTAKEYDLLRALSLSAGRVLTHTQLLRRLWGPSKPGNVQALRTHMRRLRIKLGDDARNPRYVFAQPRVGYKMPTPTPPEPTEAPSPTWP